MLSSIYTKVKPALKLLLALGILMGLSGFIYYAQLEAEKQMDEFERTKDPKTMSNNIVVNDYQLKEVDANNQPRWHLQAKKGVRQPNTRLVDLENVEVKYYADGAVSLKLSAPIGQANEISRKIKLTSNKSGKVLGIGVEKQTRMETKEMVLTKKNQFLATGGVNIDWPGVAKVTGDKAEGIMSATKFIDHLIIRGNTHAQLKM